MSCNANLNRGVDIQGQQTVLSFPVSLPAFTIHSIQSFANHLYNQFDSNEIYYEHPVDNQVFSRTLYSSLPQM